MFNEYYPNITRNVFTYWNKTVIAQLRYLHTRITSSRSTAWQGVNRNWCNNSHATRKKSSQAAESLVLFRPHLYGEGQCAMLGKINRILYQSILKHQVTQYPNSCVLLTFTTLGHAIVSTVAVNTELTFVFYIDYVAFTYRFDMIARDYPVSVLQACYTEHGAFLFHLHQTATVCFYVIQLGVPSK